MNDIFNQMVKYISQTNLNFVFSSLADPTRREILQRITKKSLTVSEIAKPYDMSLPAVSKHLKVLERAQLIKRQKEGREFRFMLNPRPLDNAIRYMTFYRKFWNEKFDNLEQYLHSSLRAKRSEARQSQRLLRRFASRNDKREEVKKNGR